jgi:hypothetical protein
MTQPEDDAARLARELPAKLGGTVLVSTEAMRHSKGCDVMKRERDRLRDSIGSKLMDAITNRGMLVIEATETQEPNNDLMAVEVTRRVTVHDGLPWMPELMRTVMERNSLRKEIAELRAQQAEPPAGCAEMANKIAVESYAEIDHVTGDCDEESIRQVAFRNIKPLFTLLKRVPEVFSDRECVLHEGYCPGCTLLADIDAVLDKGDADGGQLSPPNESEVQR